MKLLTFINNYRHIIAEDSKKEKIEKENIGFFYRLKVDYFKKNKLTKLINENSYYNFQLD